MKLIKNADKEPLGILIVNLKKDYFDNELSSVKIYKGSEICIINNETEFITDVPDEPMAEIIKECAAEDNGNKARIKGKYVYFTEKIPINGWIMAAAVPKGAFFSNTELVLIIISVIILAGVALIFLIMLFFIKEITRPLKDIERVMVSVKDNNINTRISGAILLRGDEFGVLARCCNSMLESIAQLIGKVKTESGMRMRAELAALQQQINSHFLYNTLESISAKIMCGDKKQSLKMTEMLAKYFRLALNHGNSITTVENELEHIKNYVAIEQCKSNKRINCIIDVDSVLYPIGIPKLLLQPLVENSIIHGLFNSEKEWKISVTGRCIGHSMVFEVRDNGCGFADERIDSKIRGMYEESSGENFALRNIYTRIKLFYGDEGDMFLYNGEDGGACAELVLPVNVREEDNANDNC